MTVAARNSISCERDEPVNRLAFFQVSFDLKERNTHAREKTRRNKLVVTSQEF